MKTYKLSNGSNEWLMIFENLVDKLSEDAGLPKFQKLDIPDNQFPIQEQKHSKTKHLYTMSDDIAEWLLKEIEWKIYFNSEVRETSDAYERADARQELSRWKTLKRQLEAQM